jgi:rsbT antagonist protein RsbS
VPGTPIIRLDDTLVVVVQEALPDALAIDLQDDIAEALEKNGAARLLIDISLLDVVDSFMGRTLNGIAAMARLMGARTIIAGMRPQVAITLTELGLKLEGVETVLSVERGLARLAERNGRRI